MTADLAAVERADMTTIREAVARKMFANDLIREIDADKAYTIFADMPLSGPRHVAKWATLADDAISAIASHGPTDEMVEAAARVLARDLCLGGEPDKNEIFFWPKFRNEARAALTAALGVMGKAEGGR